MDYEALCFILGKIAEADPERPILIFRSSGPPKSLVLIGGRSRREIYDLCDGEERKNLVGAFDRDSSISFIYQKLNIDLLEEFTHEQRNTDRFTSRKNALVH